MNKKRKFDLHTHCHEALGYSPPSIENVAKIVHAVRAKGLDGIAKTEHDGARFAYKVKQIIEESFDNSILIIPGMERDVGHQHIVELYLPNGSIFKFLAHPGYSMEICNNIHGIEVYSSMHHIDHAKVKRVAAQYGLVTLQNSDAHYLDDIGTFFNEISIQELANLASRN